MAAGVVKCFYDFGRGSHHDQAEVDDFVLHIVPDVWDVLNAAGHLSHVLPQVLVVERGEFH